MIFSWRIREGKDDIVRETTDVQEELEPENLVTKESVRRLPNCLIMKLKLFENRVLHHMASTIKTTWTRYSSSDNERKWNHLWLSKGFPGGSDGKASACNVGEGSVAAPGRSPGEGTGKPLQFSCLENSMDRGAWQAIVHGVEKSRTGLSDFTVTFWLSIPAWRTCWKVDFVSFI